MGWTGGIVKKRCRVSPPALPADPAFPATLPFPPFPPYNNG
jgi:hypothetical protein